MKKRLQIRPLAKEDVHEHFLRIAGENSVVAFRFLEAAEQAFNRIQGEPGVGSSRYSQTRGFPGLRMWPIRGFEKYLIFYLDADNAIDIIRVLHGARDLPQILSDSDG